jgi:two-component system phosphate regulon sensor histidine kinase PhoR
MQPQYHERKITLELETTPEGRFELTREHLTSILSNLLSNALKYTQSGGLVTVSSNFENDLLTLSVHDTGIGIAPEDRERIFEKFVQVKHRDAATPGSVGLGLTIVREIAAQYDGTVSVESEKGVGSTFTVRLHVRKVEELKAA